jgi:hypothetical protein
MTPQRSERESWFVPEESSELQRSDSHTQGFKIKEEES